ncbi:MAG: hypothetical protein KA175_16675 [Flavobacteriales bacterium]|nr:hypothetical protein [Flavobacteriales bacterium]MBP6699258.1 hypothetical protein [Flavobacteriales bacterium]
MSKIHRPGADHVGSLRSVAILRRMAIVLMTSALSFCVRAQAPTLHHYTALIAPVVPGHSPKPMIGELTEWLVGAQIGYVQPDGRLDLTTVATFTLIELRAHVEPHGFLVLSLNGETHEQTIGRASVGIPVGMVAADSAAMEPLDDAARAKAAWIEAHPDVYRGMLENGSAGDHAK